MAQTYILNTKNVRLRKNGNRWQEQNDIILQVMYGTLRIDAIKKNFYLNFPEIDVDGYNGYLKQRSAMDSVY